MRWLLMLAGLVFLPAADRLPGPVPSPCGYSPGDWCAATPGDSCGSHADAAACRADPACYGLAYRGESVVACQFDERGFGINCPTVGCTSVPPGPEQWQD